MHFQIPGSKSCDGAERGFGVCGKWDGGRGPVVEARAWLLQLRFVDFPITLGTVSQSSKPKKATLMRDVYGIHVTLVLI